MNTPSPSPTPASKPPFPTWHLFIPKSYTSWREGYSLGDFKADFFAGLTVAVVALPLATALAIASGTTPDKGLFTAVVAGFLISLLGGSRHQIGGPTGAFVVVVFNVIHQHGYEGLAVATLMAGAMLIVAGFARMGTVIKFIPYPVVTGFTSGIALIIFTSQIKDLLGLTMAEGEADFISKWSAYFAHLDTIHWPTVGLSIGSLAVILALKANKKGVPVFLAAIVAASVAAWALGLPVETIGSRFGDLPHTLPTPSLPNLSLDLMAHLLPSALTIAFLAGIESLLSCMVADGMTGRRHKSNCELVAQGVANVASVVFGGIPATGAIARTATNIKSGARTPMAGIVHAIALLLILLVFAPLASYIPLAALAAVLVIVAWNMSEIEHFRNLMHSPKSDRAVLLVTFALTVLVDLTLAIQVGIVLAALLFMKRMSDVTEIESGVRLFGDDEDDLATINTSSIKPEDVPDGVQVYQINGPFFFGAASRLADILGRLQQQPRVYVLRMRQVPVIDATGAHALWEFVSKARSSGAEVILACVNPQPLGVLERMDVAGRIGPECLTSSYREALAKSREIIARDAAANPATT